MRFVFLLSRLNWDDADREGHDFSRAIKVDREAVSGSAGRPNPSREAASRRFGQRVIELVGMLPLVDLDGQRSGDSL